MNVTDQLPRIFQANADRFYRRVVLATLDQLPTHGTLAVGQASSMDEFLEQCAAQVDNHTANEAMKAFALTLDGMFERQFNRWASECVNADKPHAYLRTLKASSDLLMAGVADDLNELHLVGNVVRHGEGRSCTELKAIAPQLWENPLLDYYDTAPGPAPLSDELRVQPNDLRRYVCAIVRFWGHHDRLPMALFDPRY